MRMPFNRPAEQGHFWIHMQQKDKTSAHLTNQVGPPQIHLLEIYRHFAAYTLSCWRVHGDVKVPDASKRVGSLPSGGLMAESLRPATINIPVMHEPSQFTPNAELSNAARACSEWYNWPSRGFHSNNASQLIEVCGWEPGRESFGLAVALGSRNAEFRPA